jgi:signal transduction histidine kinase
MRARPLTVVATVGTAVVLAAFASMLVRQRSFDAYYSLFMLHNGPSSIVLLWLGALVLRRRPGHGAGLVLLAIGVFQALHTGVAAVVDARLVAAGVEEPLTYTTSIVPADLPLDASIPLWLMAWLWVPAAVLAFTMLALVFPDGRLPSRRWRGVVAAAAAGAGLLVLAFAIDAWPTARHAGTDDVPTVVGVLAAAGSVAVMVAAIAGLVALVRRWRSADRARRSSFVAVAASVAALTVVGVATYPWQVVWIPAVLVGLNAVFVVYALAVARYRLHDLEPVLGRAAVGALLSVLVAAVYLAIVVGAGSLVGRRVESTLLPLVAVGVVALLIEPARRRARRLVDRLLYRRDADRSEVLSRLAAHASTSATGAEVLGEVAELLVRSTGATRAEAWLDGADRRLPAAAAGVGDEPEPTLCASVEHRGERFGELRLFSRTAADLVSDAPQLLGDVAGALALVLRNERLTEQLRAQLDELRASRQRLVEAHDRARRGLERDIHDGVQSRLISLRLRLGALSVRADGDSLATELDALGREVDVAVRSLRDLARGLHPPILEQSGLADALRAHVRELPLAVSVSARGVGRYRRAAEGAAYFSCLEAIQNAIRHSGAGRITVELDGDGSALRFCVRDDGAGFRVDRVAARSGLANIDDRVSALGGRTEIVSAPGRGTRVTGEIPVQSLTDDR